MTIKKQGKAAKNSGVPRTRSKATSKLKAAPSGDRSEWKKKEIERRVRREMNICRHFTGIQHETCKVGVNYRTLVGGEDHGWATRMPCFADEKSVATCEHLSFPSEEEARKDVEEQDARTMEFLAQLRSGICPICKVEVRQRQVGSCVYGTCGHRLYQGTVNKEFAA